MLQFGHACLRVETRRRRVRYRAPVASIRPRLLARGDRRVLHKHWPHVELQFGHACLRVETIRRGRFPVRCPGFNSATPACAWRRLSRCRKSPGPGASIRPRLLARGDLSALPTELQETAASIRPRLLARGDSRTSPMMPAEQWCFNSATPACAWRHLCTYLPPFGQSPLQFGHACLRVETWTWGNSRPASRVCFNSATPACAWRLFDVDTMPRSLARLQFGHACLRVETPCKRRPQKPHDGFNSATPACAWRHHQTGREVYRDIASIRPRLLARGDLAYAANPVAARMGFNSATPACAWRHARPFLLVDRVPASIRPRLLARGDARAAMVVNATFVKLQFGHACLRVETSR